MLPGVSLPILIIIILAAGLGFVAAWFMRANQLTVMQEHIRKFRNARRNTKRHIERLDARLDASLANRRIAEEELALLGQIHESLESEHAKLASRFANLTKAARDNIEATLNDPHGKSDQATGAALTRPDDLEDDPSILPSPQADLAKGGKQGNGKPDDDATDAEIAPDDGETMGGLAVDFDLIDAPVSTDLVITDTWFGETDPAPVDPKLIKEGQNELEVLKAQVVTARDELRAAVPARFTQADDDPESSLTLPASTHALTAPAEEAPEFADDSISDDDDLLDIGSVDPIAAAAAQLAQVRDTLEERDLEIRRLRQQLAPLLGLPLAVSAREAERDRLARRLAERETELARLSNQRPAAVPAGTMKPRSPDPVESPAVPEPKTQTSGSDNAPPALLPVAQAPAEPELPLAGSASANVPPLPNGDGVAVNDLSDQEMGEISDQMAALDQAVLRAGSWPDSIQVRQWLVERQDRSAGAPPSAADRTEPTPTLPTTPPAADTGPGRKPLVPPGQSAPPALDITVDPAPRQYVDVPEQIDNLQEIQTIGPSLERKLNELGVYQFRQIASWTESDIDFFDNQLGDFRGRIRRDAWINRARVALDLRRTKK